VIEGADAPIDASAVAALVTNGAEVELERGGQPSWWWLVASE
jgi:hypothetical protein